MTIKEKAAAVYSILEKKYPYAECSLSYEGEPWKLLVMARLSAQCTDERVNTVSETLFSRFPTAKALAEAPLSEIENTVRSCGLYHTKARDIKAECEIIVQDFSGRVPDTMEELLSLPGVGRKIANLILGDVYKNGGIVADTHCIRIANRLGLASKKNPLDVEKALSVLIPHEGQSDFCHRLVLFGREICPARNPKCGECPLKAEGVCNGTEN